VSETHTFATLNPTCGCGDPQKAAAIPGEGCVDQAGQGAFGLQMRAKVGMADAGIEDVVDIRGFGEA
jgi:hypothetical protein